jgi:hypothetical protein
LWGKNCMEKKKEATGDIKRIIAREAKILTKYSRYFDHVSVLAKYHSLVMPMLKDVVPDKKEQALIFREIKVLQFKGGGIEYLCWLSLTHLMVDVRRQISQPIENISMVELVKHIIEFAYKSDLVCSIDIVNFLRLFGYGEYFYFYLECERDNCDFPFAITEDDPTLEEPFAEKTSLLEMAKCNAMLSPFFELAYGEIQTKIKYPKREKIFNLCRKIYEIQLD